ncbi:MAG: hypothetical protein R3D44_03225 [Hyphomicrobiaceae bacterium]
MSTYEARRDCRATTAFHHDVSQRPRVTPEMVQAAIQRGRRERSQAMWAMLQAVFGRSDERDETESEPTGFEKPAATRR